MATDVVMPQMGESIAEGTIVRWIKKVGDKVDRDEPLFEISTDKVDAEIPSPAAGVVSEIRVKEGETVPVNSVVAVIGAAGAAASAPAAEPPKAPARAAEPPKASPQGDGSPTASAPPKEQAPQSAPARETSSGGARTTEDLVRERSSPLVRKIAKENNIDIAQIRGTGIAGRVTKDDILEFLARQEGSKAERQEGKVERQEARAERQEGQAARSASLSGERERQQEARAPVPAAPKFTPGAGDVVEKMSAMRKRIAEHM